MKTKISGLKKAMLAMAAFLFLSGCATATRFATFSKEVAEQRKWTDQRDENYFYGHKGYPCNGPERECVERAIPSGWSKMDDWVFENL